nr:hypothetical protein [Tanacetum cinerariifolium]
MQNRAQDKLIERSVDERALHKREYDTKVNERQIQTTKGKVYTCKALDASLGNAASSRTESEKQDTSSRSRNDAHADDAYIRPIYDEETMVERSNAWNTLKKSIDKRAQQKREYESRWEKHGNARYKQHVRDADDADIKQIYDEESMDEVQITVENNVFATGQQHTEQPEFNNKGEVDQNAEQFTTHYFPKEKEYVVVKPHHVIASSESRNSSKNMSRFSSNDMFHKYYLEEAKKKTQESGRNSRPSVTPSARSQSTTNGSKPKPRINYQNSRNWPASKRSYVTTKTVPIAEHSKKFGFKEFCSDEQEMTSDHNSSKLRIHDHSNE